MAPPVHIAVCGLSERPVPVETGRELRVGLRPGGVVRHVVGEPEIGDSARRKVVVEIEKLHNAILNRPKRAQLDPVESVLDRTANHDRPKRQHKHLLLRVVSKSPCDTTHFEDILLSHKTVAAISTTPRATDAFRYLVAVVVE